MGKFSAAHLGRPYGMDRVRCVIYAASIVPQRDGGPIPYPGSGVAGVIYGAVCHVQRAGLEISPYPVTGDVRCNEKPPSPA